MALKPDRVQNPFGDDMTWFMNEVAERGGIASASTVGSGAALDQSQQLCTYAANPSGVMPIGLLLNDMVNKDLSQTHLNAYNGELQKGSKVLLSADGTYHTNMIYPGLSITGKQSAYLGPSGLLTTNYVNDSASPVVGRFISSKDEDGYVRVQIKLPQGTPRL
jgi:hypothetical protein